MTYCIDLWNNLESLVKGTDAFYSKDFELDSQIFRIYSYRLASWSEFQLPNALDARGVMFDVTDVSAPRLVCLPQQKCFNFSEGTVDHDVCKIALVMDKRDGSLISSYIDQRGVLRLKSKASLFSQQAIDSQKWLNANPELRQQIMQAEMDGYTVNMEWTSPENRIVVPYSSPELRVLNIRNRNNGETVTPGHPRMQPFSQWLVDHWYLDSETLPSQAEKSALVLQEGEGYVVELLPPEGGKYFVKCKSEKYVLLHRNKDSINHVRSLFELAVNEGTDDIKELFATDAAAIELVEKMENHVFPIYNSICRRVDDFWQTNRTLDRKEYAILATQTNQDIMSLLMNRYIGREVDVKSFMIKNYDTYRPTDIFDKTED